MSADNEYPKLLFSERPYAASIAGDFFDGTTCFSCFKRTKVSRCAKCGLAWYCSRDCQNYDWTVTAQHLRECKVFQACPKSDLPILKGNEVLRLVARIFSRKAKDGGESWLKEDVTEFPPEYKSWEEQMKPARNLKDLLTNADKISGAMLQKGWMIFGRLFGSKSKFFAEMSQQEYGEIFGMVQTNSFAIVDYEIYLGQLGLGTGLYLECSRFNHACDPDLFRSLNGSNRMMKLLRPLNPATTQFNELTVNYRISFGSGISLTRERQRHLAEDSFFVCGCRLCLDERSDQIKEFSVAKKCPLGHQAMVAIWENEKEPEHMQYRCDECDWALIGKAPEAEAKGTHYLIENMRGLSDKNGGRPIEEDPFRFIAKAENILHPIRSIWIIRLREEAMDQEWEILRVTDQDRCRVQLLHHGSLLLESYRYYKVNSSFFPVLCSKLARLHAEKGEIKEAIPLYEEAKKLWETAVCDAKHHTVLKMNSILSELKAM